MNIKEDKKDLLKELLASEEPLGTIAIFAERWAEWMEIYIDEGRIFENAVIPAITTASIKILGKRKRPEDMEIVVAMGILANIWNRGDELLLWFENYNIMNTLLLNMQI